MTTHDDLPIPAELALPGEAPFTDEDLDLALDTVDVGTLASLTAEEVAASDDEVPRRQTAMVRTAGWRIGSPEEAEWAARKYADAAQHVDDVAGQAEAWRQRIDQWETAEVGRIASRVSFFEHALIGYGAERRREDPKRNKTTRLPSATVSSTAKNVGGAVVVVDEEAVIEWAEGSLQGAEYDQVVKSTTSVLLTGLRARVKIVDEPLGDNPPEGKVPDRIVVDLAGQVVPGVQIEPETVGYKVKPV